MKNKKVTRRKKSSKPREEWAHLPVEKRPVILDELKVKGFRYPLERNRVFKVNANKRHAGRGWVEVQTNNSMARWFNRD